MNMSLVQYRSNNDERAVAAFEGDGDVRRVLGVETTYALAKAASLEGRTLTEKVLALGLGEVVDVEILTSAGRLLAPIDHPEPARLYITGTGLTHLGSAEGRDAMHRAAKESEAPTDSMRMFLMGLEGGKPADGDLGVQPEWFYKGNGQTIVAPGAPLTFPDFALDAGEEPELAGVYLIADDGTPLRLGCCLANEFSDHVTERENYLWLSHSKLRPTALGPELRTGQLPGDVRGVSRVLRNGESIWQKPFLTGEENMSHTLENLEHHHFKYAFFRRPGDIHVHFFGTATLSFMDGLRTQEKDVFEITAEPFRFALRNGLVRVSASPVRVRAL